MASKVANKVSKNGTHWLWPSITCISVGLFGYSNISNYNKYKFSLKQFETEISNLKQTIRLQNESIIKHTPIDTPINTTTNTIDNNPIIRNSYSDIIKSISPAIANLVIESESRVNFGFFQVQQPIKSLGTGVIIRNDGIIVTNNHVISNKDLNNNNSNDQTITVYLSNNRKVNAHIILKDELNDLALLKIDSNNEIFPYIEINNNISNISVGDKVLAIGNNLGLHNTVTDGIISAIGRAQASHINNNEAETNNQTNISELKISNNPYLPFFQTNAAINQGSSGGPLIDLNGKLIGINAAIASPFGINIGIGFAIPSNYVSLLLNSLNAPYIYNGQIIRPWDGLNVNKQFVNMKYLSDEIINKLNELNVINKYNNYNYIDGVQIIDIHTQSPAKVSGIEYDDILIMVNKNIVIDSQDKYWMTLNSFKPNEKVNYLILRYNNSINGYELLEFDVEIQMPPEATYTDVRVKDGRNVLNGCVVGELQPSLGIELGINPCKEGVMVMEIPYKSFAAHSGFKPGDLVLEIDGLKINNVEQLKKLNINRNKRHNIVIQRGDMVGELNV